MKTPKTKTPRMERIAKILRETERGAADVPIISAILAQFLICRALDESRARKQMERKSRRIRATHTSAAMSSARKELGAMVLSFPLVGEDHPLRRHAAGILFKSALLSMFLHGLSLI